MKPNLFIFYPYYPEDFFSMSLAYIINLFPDIGQKLVRKVAVLAGKKSDYFGEFGHCEFVGWEFPEEHTASKPDLKILCSEGTIYFENKLDAPLSLDQMQRHSSLTRRDPKSRLIFVSNIHHENARLRSLPGYLHPESADHYLWVDLQPVFANPHRTNSLAGKVLTDFNAALKVNGMIGRTIKGASDSLYTHNSEASHLALRQLGDVLKELGFKLSKKHARESTLRVYPVKYRQYPLLNPRFTQTAAWLGEEWDRECLVFYVGPVDDLLDRQLGAFHSTPECAFIAPFENASGSSYHHLFSFRLNFTGSKATNWEIDFTALKPHFARMLDFLKGCKN